MVKVTTLCYIRKDAQVLMLLRNKKAHDENEGKWIGVGGKLEQGETPHECVCREVLEETGLKLTDYRFRGMISFISDVWEDELMLLYEASGFEGELKMDCSEGTLRWILQDQVMQLPLWEGDRLFLEKLLQSDEIFSMKLVYRGEELVSSTEY